MCQMLCVFLCYIYNLLGFNDIQLHHKFISIWLHLTDMLVIGQTKIWIVSSIVFCISQYSWMVL